MTRVHDQAMVITGAASGLGRLMAQRFGRLGARLVLWDVDEAGLAHTAGLVADEVGRRPAEVVVDLTETASIDAAAQASRDAAGDPHVVINNAGVTSGQRLTELSDAQIETTMRVNATAPMLVTKRFLPAMIDRDAGHVVTIASAAGLTGVARLMAYCASKHAAVGFADALRHELRTVAPGVRTTLVCPYFIDTGLFAGVRTRFPWLLPILDPDDVADRIVRAVLRDRRRLTMPWLVKAVPALRALPPVITDPIADVLGVNASMDEFRGRADAPLPGSRGTAERPDG